MRCQRCYNEMRVHTVSIFNTQEICMDCAKKEKAHPEYENARKRESWKKFVRVTTILKELENL